MLNPMFIVAGETREQALARRAEHLRRRAHREEIIAGESPFHPWNRPGLSHDDKLRARDQHIARRDAQSASSALSGLSSFFGGSPGFDGASSFIGATEEQGAGAPKFTDNLLLLAGAGAVLWFVLRRRKGR